MAAKNQEVQDLNQRIRELKTVAREVLHCWIDGDEEAMCTAMVELARSMKQAE